MANINITLDHPLKDGETITFKAPCDCTAVEGMVIQYPNDDGSATSSQTFTFKDSHNNDLTGLGNLFSEGAVVVVAVSTEDSAVQILNAATNGYLESKSVGVETSKLTITSSGTTVSGTVYKQQLGKLVHVVGAISFTNSSVLSSVQMSLSELPTANTSIPTGCCVAMCSTFASNAVTSSYTFLELSLVYSTKTVTFKKAAGDTFVAGSHSINFDFWYEAA